MGFAELREKYGSVSTGRVVVNKAIREEIPAAERFWICSPSFDGVGKGGVTTTNFLKASIKR